MFGRFLVSTVRYILEDRCNFCMLLTNHYYIMNFCSLSQQNMSLVCQCLVLQDDYSSYRKPVPVLVSSESTCSRGP